MNKVVLTEESLKEENASFFFPPKKNKQLKLSQKKILIKEKSIPQKDFSEYYYFLGIPKNEKKSLFIEKKRKSLSQLKKNSEEKFVLNKKTSLIEKPFYENDSLRYNPFCKKKKEKCQSEFLIKKKENCFLNQYKKTENEIFENNFFFNKLKPFQNIVKRRENELNNSCHNFFKNKKILTSKNSVLSNISLKNNLEKYGLNEILEKEDGEIKNKLKKIIDRIKKTKIKNQINDFEQKKILNKIRYINRVKKEEKKIIPFQNFAKEFISEKEEHIFKENSIKKNKSKKLLNYYKKEWQKNDIQKFCKRLKFFTNKINNDFNSFLTKKIV